MSEAALRVSEVSKRFDGIAALDQVSLEVAPGEIHALLGENGAGKSTLIRIITGAMSPDSGSVELAGQPVDFHSVRDGLAAGVVALYQESAAIPTLTVAENILVGSHLPTRGGFVRGRELHRRARESLDALGQTDIPTDVQISELSPVKQTMVALARALVVDARVLILDEPTAALTDQEIQQMFSVLRDLRAQGVAIIYVSHRLEEVFELCDRLTVMRNGRHVATERVSESSIDDVIRLMVGRQPSQIFPDRASRVGDVGLTVDRLSGRRVDEVSLTARRGEILGVGGLAGSGRSELLRLLAGAQRRSSGAISVDGVPSSYRTVAQGLDDGVAYLPEERRTQGLILGQSIRENLSLPSLISVSTGGMMSKVRETKLAEWAISELRVKATGPKQPVGRLSGGNQQKVALAKYLARKPRVLLLDEPTRGVDVGAKVELYDLIRRIADDGSVVIVVSSDLHELIGIADRIAIMRDGRLVATTVAAESDQELLLNHCYARTAA